MINLVKNKKFQISLVIICIILAIFIVSISILKYQVEGEPNLPFNLTKIIIVSDTEGIDKEDPNNKWSLNINQINDVYLYIEKNENNKKSEVIDSVTLDNFKISRNSTLGTVAILKPDSTSTNLFKTSQENIVDSITYNGDLESNVNEMKISNQGGKVVFRYALTNLGTYSSNDDSEIHYNELLQKLGVNKEDLKVNLSFDINIKLISGKIYQATASLDLPAGDVFNGSSHLELTDLSNIIFKRIQN